MRLFAFHHAGGGPESFLGWRDRLGPGAEIVPVRLPTRAGARFDMDTLVAELNRELGPALYARHVFYGHSMGALVAYHLARLRHSLDEPLPEALLLGACAAPHLPRRLASTWTDDLLARWLLALGGLPARSARTPEWREVALHRVREHLAICETAADPVGTAPLPCAVHVFAGQADSLVAPAHAAAWAPYTSGPFEVHPVPGGHFFFRESRGAFFARLRAVITDLATRGPAARSSSMTVR
jgi:surfactin synthase thioesterase subunit